MHILITGAAGFVGSHLGEYLWSLGHQIVGLDNFSHGHYHSDHYAIDYGDVRYSEDLDAYIAGAELVYHLAAQINVDKSIAHPQETMDINLRGTENVLNSCRRHHVPLVFASTSEVYGSHNDAISENHATHAQSPYAVSKLAADKLCGNYHDLYKLPVYRVRCFNIFGPRQSADTYGAVIPIFAQKMLAGETPIIFGDGAQERDWIYIDDVVRAYNIIPSLPRMAGEIINVGTGTTVSVNHLVEIINHHLGTNIVAQHAPARAGEVRRLQADISYLNLNYGFRPLVSFDEGMGRYLAWLQQQK